MVEQSLRKRKVGSSILPVGSPFSFTPFYTCVLGISLRINQLTYLISLKKSPVIYIVFIPAAATMVRQVVLQFPRLVVVPAS